MKPCSKIKSRAFCKSVTRALGDRGLKAPFKLLTCKPELHKVEVGENDLFVVMACDGVWDVLSDQEACDVVAEHMGIVLASHQCAGRNVFSVHDISLRDVRITFFLPHRAYLCSFQKTERCYVKLLKKNS